MLIINPSFLRFLAPWCIWRSDPAKRAVYLTFDDGPHPKHTPEILRILNKSDVQAAFFLSGEKIMRYPGLVKQINKDGHVIGNHGFSHTSLVCKKREFVFGEIERTNRMIEKITGFTPHFFRPPYGRFDFRFKHWMIELDMFMVNWSLLTEDFRDHEPAFFVKRIQDHIHPGAIILMHDGLNTTPNLIQALPDMLEFLNKKHYNIGALSELER